MKEWVFDYSIKYSDDTVEENRSTVSADTISFAIEAATQRLQELVDESDDPAAVDAVIWNIGMIVEDDLDPLEVFG